MPACGCCANVGRCCMKGMPRNSCARPSQTWWSIAQPFAWIIRSWRWPSSWVFHWCVGRCYWQLWRINAGRFVWRACMGRPLPRRCWLTRLNNWRLRPDSRWGLACRNWGVRLAWALTLRLGFRWRRMKAMGPYVSFIPNRPSCSISMRSTWIISPTSRRCAMSL